MVISQCHTTPKGIWKTITIPLLTYDLLKKYDYDGTSYVDMEEQNANKNRIVDTLRNFRIEISSIKATVGAR